MKTGRTAKNRKKGMLRAVGLLLLTSLIFGGCGDGRMSNGSKGLNDAEQSAGDAGADGAASGNAGSAEVTLLDVSNLFTDRDKEIGYDEDRAVKILLQGDSASADSKSVQTDGNRVTITQEGCYILSGSLAGSLTVDADKKAKIQLVLAGAEISCADSAALYIRQADKVFVTTASGSENVLETTGAYQAIDDNHIDGAVFAKDDITFNGMGSLKVTSAKGHGIVCKNDLVITGGSYEITAAEHGLQGKDSVRIANGNIRIKAGKDGVHSGNDEDEAKGFTYIAGGEIVLDVEDDGIHSETELVIAGGNIRIEKSYEGIEGKAIEIAGGECFVKASDDGLNAAGGSGGSGRQGRFGFGGDPFAADEDCKILISGGTLTIDADGDGIDSNGNLYVHGGNTLVYGSTNGMNAALDYNGEATITGGRVIAIGFSQMAQNFGKDSTQCSMLVNVSGSQGAGSALELKDGAGRQLLSANAEKTFNSVVFSCPEIQTGESYTVAMGTATVSVEMTETIYGKGMDMGDFGGGRMPFGGEMPEMPDGGFPEGKGPWGEMPDGGFPQGGERPQRQHSDGRGRESKGL